MSTPYEPSSSFRDAAAYLSNATALANVSNAIKLELYGLFKCVTVSTTPTTSRPGIFDFAGRAKWDAWSSAGSTYANRLAEAERRYFDIAQGLGWKEGKGDEAAIAAASAQALQSDKNVDDEDIWDDDDASSAKRSGGGGGMGNAVSTMTANTQAEQEGESLHSLARSGNAEGLKTFMSNHEDADVNAKDEYGYTPLHLACDRGHKAVVELLLSLGADTDIQDEDEFTALELAQIAEHGDIVALLQKS